MDMNDKASEQGRITHLDAAGRPRMVDISDKLETAREATAVGWVSMSSATLQLVQRGAIAKGDVLATAQVAAIMAAKRTWEFIPMCHPLLLSGVAVEFAIPDNGGRVNITVAVKTVGRTGVEMEALTAVSAAALTIYDMCKAVDKTMVIGGVHLRHKSGGRSGEFDYPDVQLTGSETAHD